MVRAKQLALPGANPVRRPRKRRRPAVPRAEQRRNVPHRTRPWHDGRHPVHVTLRANREVPYLRKQVVLRRIVETFRKANRDASFRIVHFSVQADHLHLVVEAASREILASRMNGLTTWVARKINEAVGRRGKVWGGRYHRHDLATPTEVRNALLYVLQNRRKHVIASGGADPGGFDVYSSAAWLEGWEDAAAEKLVALRREQGRLLGPGPPVVSPKRWLTGAGWRRARGGVLRASEVPSTTAAPPRH